MPVKTEVSQVVFYHHDSLYLKMVEEYYARMGEHKPGPVFCHDIDSAELLLDGGIPMTFIVPAQVDGKDARRWASNIRIRHPYLIEGILIYSFSPVRQLGRSVDGYLHKSGLRESLDEICSVMNDLAEGMALDEIFAKYPTIVPSA